jgi:hypothetical protein
MRLHSALVRGIPFGLRTRDGREFSVPAPESALLPEGADYVLLFDHAGHLTVLPLTSVTGLVESEPEWRPVVV